MKTGKDLRAQCVQWCETHKGYFRMSYEQRAELEKEFIFEQMAALHNRVKFLENHGRGLE